MTITDTTGTAPAHPATHSDRVVPWQTGALQAIFAVFLGIITAIVVGVGVNTFHPNPADEVRQEQLQPLYQQQGAAIVDKAGVPADQLTAQELQARIVALEAQATELEEQWAAGTSLIVIGLATVLLALAVLLARVPRTWVFSTGLLLGGIFAMLYGVALSLMAQGSVTRFGVLLLALAITCALGYLRFVRGHGPTPAPAGTPSAGAGSPELAPLEQRVAAIEHTLSTLRSALGSTQR